MEWIKIVANWFAENESVLSGLAAFVALIGLLLSPLGGNLKGLFARFRKPTEPVIALSTANDDAPQLKVRNAGKPTIFIESFTSSSDAAHSFSLELNDEVRRAVTNFTGSVLVTDIARADYVANVTILLTGSRCRATLRLQDRHSNEDFWSGRFEADIDDRLQAIDQLSSKLSTHIRYETARHVASRGDDNFEVKLTRMGFAMISADPKVWDEAIATADSLLVEQKDNSMFQCIYGGLLLRELALGYREPSPEDMEKAQQALRRAVMLNERSDFAHAMLGRYLLYCQRDYSGARRSYARSLQVNPLYHFAQSGLGFVEIFAGDAHQGIDFLNKANATEHYKKSGQFVQAIAAGEIKLGNYARAVEWIEQEQNLEDDYTGTQIALAAAAGLAGNIAVAQQAVASLKEKHPEITVAAIRRWPYSEDAHWDLFVSGLKKAGLE